MYVNFSEETVVNIDLWTNGTVEPASLKKVLEKIQAGSTCVITGSPGEGKTTLGYLVLKHLQETRQVYKVSSPEQFDEVIKTSSPVILIDDIFGQTLFKETAWEQWKERIEKFINMNENKPINEIGNLILIGRDFVLKSGSRNTEDPWEMFINKRNTVNISSGVVRGKEEKNNILNSIAKKV
jgi:energy-coupling factor transporter ATP-binding protein EcfA2